MWDGNILSPYLPAWLIARRTLNGNDSCGRARSRCRSFLYMTKEDLEAIRLDKEAILQMLVRSPCGDSQCSTMAATKSFRARGVSLLQALTFSLETGVESGLAVLADRLSWESWDPGGRTRCSSQPGHLRE